MGDLEAAKLKLYIYRPHETAWKRRACALGWKV
jgi:hypothetical protein